jgi:hypothetical protein
MDRLSTETAYDDAHSTNVYVLLEHIGREMINAVYGPFHSRNAAKDWGLINVTSFTIMEIMRPKDVEEVGFVLTPAHTEPTLEDQGIHPEQAQIGDYIDPSVTRP